MVLLLSLAGCFLLSSPEPERSCGAPHLWYAPDESGDVYFGCTPPTGWVQTPPDEERFASPPPPPPPPPDTDTGTGTTDGWVPPVADTSGTYPETGWIDTGLLVDTADTASVGDTGLGGPDPDDTGAEPGDTGLVDTADTGPIDTADTGLPPEEGAGDTGLPPGEEGGGDTGLEGLPLEEIPLRDDEIAVETPDGIRVLSPADTGYWIELDELNAPR